MGWFRLLGVCSHTIETTTFDTFEFYSIFNCKTRSISSNADGGSKFFSKHYSEVKQDIFGGLKHFFVVQRTNEQKKQGHPKFPSQRLNCNDDFIT